MWGLRSCEGRLGRTRFEDYTMVWAFYDAFDDVVERLTYTTAVFADVLKNWQPIFSANTTTSAMGT
jgi:hypothetical protein